MDSVTERRCALSFPSFLSYLLIFFRPTLQKEVLDVHDGFDGHM